MIPPKLVYFIRAGEAGPIKIGISVDPARRLISMQSDNALSLELLGTLPGGWKREQELHRQFSAHRIGGEWFHPHPEVLAIVATAVPFITVDQLRRSTSVVAGEHPLKSWRRRQRQTQQGFAAMIGVSQPTIARLEKGGETTSRIVKKIHKATGGEVDPDLMAAWV